MNTVYDMKIPKNVCKRPFFYITSLECRLRQFLLFLHLNYALPFPCLVLPREGLGNQRYLKITKEVIIITSNKYTVMG